MHSEIAIMVSETPSETEPLDVQGQKRLDLLTIQIKDSADDCKCFSSFKGVVAGVWHVSRVVGQIPCWFHVLVIRTFEWNFIEISFIHVVTFYGNHKTSYS